MICHICRPSCPAWEKFSLSFSFWKRPDCTSAAGERWELPSPTALVNARLRHSRLYATTFLMGWSLNLKKEEFQLEQGKKNALMLTQLRCSLRASSASLLVSVSVSFLKSLLSLLCPGWCQAKTEEKVWITPPMLRLALPSAKRLPFSCLFCLPLPPFFCMCGGVKRLWICSVTAKEPRVSVRVRPGFQTWKPWRRRRRADKGDQRTGLGEADKGASPPFL